MAGYLEELDRLQGRVNALFERILLGPDYDATGEALPGSWAPPVDVLETEEAFLVFAELPGVSRRDIELEVLDRRLELSGSRGPDGAAEGSFCRMEGSYGPFRRVFDLGARVRSEDIEAVFERGVLRITLPKRRRRIEARVEGEVES